jgi:DNA-binding transcriptional regulator YdaS (Cro superfamily)
MTTFADFVAWAGSQRKAADLIGISRFRVCRILRGQMDLRPSEAARAEEASGGLFHRADLIRWDEPQKAA